MSKFRVLVPEVHYQTVEVEAENADEAQSLVAAGDGNYLDGELEYSHTLDVEDWDISHVEEV